jgi:hypothetical protein
MRVPNPTELPGSAAPRAVQRRGELGGRLDKFPPAREHDSDAWPKRVPNIPTLARCGSKCAKGTGRIPDRANHARPAHTKRHLLLQAFGPFLYNHQCQNTLLTNRKELESHRACARQEH